MRVTRGDARATSSTHAIRPATRFNVALLVGLLFLAFVLGFIVCRQGWHRALADFTTSFVRHPGSTIAALSHRSDVPALQIDLPFKEYQRLLDRRAQALALGVNTASDQDYVSASIQCDGTTVVVLMRLPEGPAAGLAGEEWPFEVWVQDGVLLGLRRFELAPADTTVLSTWGYLETLRRNGLLSTRYSFVHVTLNGTSKGLYVLEEEPATESLAAWGRTSDVILSFDQSTYWEARAWLGDALSGNGFQYARIAGVCPPSPVISDVQSVAVTSTQDSLCSAAIRDLQALQVGERAPADVLDSEKMGEFLALTTLWRGTSQLDWRTTYLAYGQTERRFEPVGTANVLTPLAPLADSLIDDPQIQVAYVHALERFGDPDYLTELQADLEGDLETLQQMLGAELGYLELPWSTLEAHQAAMRHQLAPSQPLLAYVEADDTALVLRLSNTQPFPVEVTGLDIGENALLAAVPAWVDESDRDALVDTTDLGSEGGIVLRAASAAGPRSIHLRVPPELLPAGAGWAQQTPGGVQIVTHLSGLANQRLVVIAYPDNYVIFVAEGGRP